MRTDMTLESTMEIVSFVAGFFAGVGLGWFAVYPKRRADRNIQQILDKMPEREEVAQQILVNPNSENIQRGRDLVVRVLESISPEDRRQILSALNQESVRGRAWYVARLVTAGRSNHLRRIPTDQWVST